MAKRNNDKLSIGYVKARDLFKKNAKSPSQEYNNLLEEWKALQEKEQAAFEAYTQFDWQKSMSIYDSQLNKLRENVNSDNDMSDFLNFEFNKF
jgi:hypothetical protein